MTMTDPGTSHFGNTGIEICCPVHTRWSPVRRLRT